MVVHMQTKVSPRNLRLLVTLFELRPLVKITIMRKINKNNDNGSLTRIEIIYNIP